MLPCQIFVKLLPNISAILVLVEVGVENMGTDVTIGDISSSSRVAMLAGLHITGVNRGEIFGSPTIAE